MAKELERSLLARMLRAGIIDALTFQSRVQALDYSVDDTFKMLKLEQSEAVKTTLRSEGWFSPSVGGNEKGHYEAISESVNVEGFSYLMLRVYYDKKSSVTGSVQILEYNAANALVSTKSVPTSYLGVLVGEYTETVSYAWSQEVATVSIKIKCTADPIEPWKKPIVYVLKYLEGVKI